MARFAERTGRRMHVVDYFGDPEAERVLVLMGSGAETAIETADALNARGREGRRRAGAAVPAVPGRGARRGAAPERAQGRPCSTGRRSPARWASRSTTTSSPRCAEADRRHADDRRRPLRALVEGVHAGRWSPASSTSSRRNGRSATSRSASATTSPARASTTTPTLDIEPPGTVRADLLRPGLRRHRRREQEHDQDPRRRGGPARAGLLRLRLEEVRLADRVAPALRPAADPRAVPRAAARASSAATSSASLDRADVLGRGGARRDAPAQLPARRRTRSGTRCRARCRSRSWPSRSTST